MCSAGLRVSRCAPIFPIWPAIDPEAQRITAQLPNGRRATATPLRQKPNNGGILRIIAVFSLISVLLGVPRVSGACASQAFTPIWPFAGPNDQRVSAKPPNG